MLELFLTLLIIAAVFAIVVVLGGRFASAQISRAVGLREEENNWILSSGIAPPSWVRPYQRRIRLLVRLGAGSETIESAKVRYKDRLERRLHRMLRSIERSNVIPDENLRRTTASTVRFVGRSWEEGTWESVTGQSDDPA